jgi:undecaprenyl-diphosphatase
MPGVTYFEAIFVGLLQGVSELFPVSSLGHSVLLPALIGGQWGRDLSMTGKDSPYLAILVAMHVATALALALFFWRDWVRLIGALAGSIYRRRIHTPEERLIWLMIVGTIPVGLVGLGADALRSYLGAPILVAIFLTFNGVLLYSAERLRRGRSTDADLPKRRAGRHSAELSAEQTVVMSTSSAGTASEQTVVMATTTEEAAADRRLSALSFREASIIGAGQILGLLPGFSRSGGTIAAGLFRGLRHADAARFAFLLATPVILAAGVLKLPSLFTPANHAVLGPALAGSLVAAIASYAAVRFLTSYFETRTLIPFAIYSVVAGLGSLIYLTV